MRRKLLLLGGSAQQIVAIRTARQLGFTTVLCDYLPDNPGQHAADKFYQISTTDKDAVLAIAQQERIDGIIAYASDPAAPTAAYVAEKLGLPTNPYHSVETLCNKNLFRRFLAENGFNTPRANSYTTPADALRDSTRPNFPVIIKPVDSSGSKGVTVLRDSFGLKEAVDHAFSFSRSKQVIVEEFVEKKHPYLVGGDIFVIDGKICLWGLLNCHRDTRANPLVPVGKSYPLALDQSDEEAVRQTLQRLVDKLQIRTGAMNVELIVDQNGRVWPIDVGPRNGGNMIPDLLGYIFGVDVVEMSIKAAMGDPISACFPTAPACCFATHNLHAVADGLFDSVSFSSELEKQILRTCLYKHPGDTVEFFDNASKALGIVFMRFDNQSQMMHVLSHINEHIQVHLQ